LRRRLRQTLGAHGRRRISRRTEIRAATRCRLHRAAPSAG
jgi:hypothetical protein